MDFLAYQDLGTGNLIQIIENGAEAVKKILTGFYINNLAGLAQVVIGLYFINYYDRTLFLAILVGYGVFYLVSNTIHAGPARRAGENALQPGGFLQIRRAHLYGAGGFPGEWPVQSRVSAPAGNIR